MQITNGIHALKVTFTIPVAPDRTVDRFVYVYFILGAKLTLIDTGVAPAVPALLDYIRETGFTPEAIEQVVFTHAHPDHIGGALRLRETAVFNCMAHEAASPWIEDTQLQFNQRPVPGFNVLVAGSVSLDRTLADNDTVQTAAGPLRVIHTPGHSPGHCALLLEAQGVLFTGDAIPMAGTMPVYDDVARCAASLRRLAGLSGIKHVLSSWDEPREGTELNPLVAQGLQFMQGIHTGVGQAREACGSDDPQAVAAALIQARGLPPFFMNPIFTRTVAAHLAFGDGKIG